MKKFIMKILNIWVFDFPPMKWIKSFVYWFALKSAKHIRYTHSNRGEIQAFLNKELNNNWSLWFGSLLKEVRDGSFKGDDLDITADINQVIKMMKKNKENIFEICMKDNLILEVRIKYGNAIFDIFPKYKNKIAFSYSILNSKFKDGVMTNAGYGYMPSNINLNNTKISGNGWRVISDHDTSLEDMFGNWNKRIGAGEWSKKALDPEYLNKRIKVSENAIAFRDKNKISEIIDRLGDING